MGRFSLNTPSLFKFRQYQSIVAVSDPVAKYDNAVLNMEESDTALSFDDNDEEMTILGYSSKEDIFERLEKKRNDAKMTVHLPSLSQDNVMNKVDRFSVIEELFSVLGKRVGSKFLNLEYKDEEAFGDGVTKDVYSYFFEELFRFRCAGIDASALTSLNDE